MLHVICDICKKHIPGATSGYSWDKREKNYRIVLDKAICYSCMDQLDKEVNEDLSEKAEFQLLDRNRVFKNTLDRLCQ